MFKPFIGLKYDVKGAEIFIWTVIDKCSREKNCVEYSAHKEVLIHTNGKCTPRVQTWEFYLWVPHAQIWAAFGSSKACDFATLLPMNCMHLMILAIFLTMLLNTKVSVYLGKSLYGVHGLNKDNLLKNF